MPAFLAALGLASSAVAHWLRAAAPLLLLLSAALLGRAHHQLWVKRHGAAPLARAFTILLTLLAAALWALRLSPRFASFVLG